MEKQYTYVAGFSRDEQQMFAMRGRWIGDCRHTLEQEARMTYGHDCILLSPRTAERLYKELNRSREC